MKGRKFRMQIASVLPSEADCIFDELSKTHSLWYVGVYHVQNIAYLCVHTRNTVSGKNLKKMVQALGIDVGTIEGNVLFFGNIQSEKGTKLKHGGTRIIKSSGSSPRVKKARTISPEVQPAATPLKKPRVDNSIHLLDNVYPNYIAGPVGEHSFHAVWSSVEGLWSPVMWVGPSKNIVPAKRTSPKPSVIKKLFEEQDNKCRLCSTPIYMGTYSNSDVDHIIPFRYGGTSSKSNLQAICVTCHRRKTALECKKLTTRMSDPDVEWSDGSVYVTNSHVHYEPEVISNSNPKDALIVLGSRAFLFALEY